VRIGKWYWKLLTKVAVFHPVDSKESKWEVIRGLRFKALKMNPRFDYLLAHLVPVADNKIFISHDHKNSQAGCEMRQN